MGKMRGLKRLPSSPPRGMVTGGLLPGSRMMPKREERDMNKTETAVGGMRRFATLALKLGTSTKTNDRLEALEGYFTEASDADKVWMIALFSGRRPKRTVNTAQLWEWCRELTGLPGWLFEESYHTVGDLAETIALLLPDADSRENTQESLAYYLIRLAELAKEDETAKKT